MPPDAASGTAALLTALLSWTLVAGVLLVPAAILFFLPRPVSLRIETSTLDAGPRFFAEVGLVLLLAVGVESALVQLLTYGQADEATDANWMRRVLLAKLVFCPIAVFFSIFIPWMVSRTRPAQLGVTVGRLRAEVLLGYLVWLLVTPVVLFVHWCVLQSVEREAHPVELILVQTPDIGGWVLVLAAVLFVAPLVEELVVRGVVQPWLSQNPRGADAVVLAAFLGVLGFVCADLLEGRGLASGWLIVELIALGPGYCFLYLVWDGQSRTGGACRGIFAASVLFAVSHPWPTPIPLFLLSLALGWLRHWTGSLVAPITAHVLFNLVGLLPFMLKQLGAW